MLLVYQTIDTPSKAEIGLPSSVDVDQTIRQGIELLSRVGGQIHPLAARYGQSIQQLQARLKVLATSKHRPPSNEAHNRHTPISGSSFGSLPAQPQFSAIPFQQPPGLQHQQTGLEPGYAYQSAAGEVALNVDFDSEFANIESMLMDSTGWTGLMNDWSDNPVRFHHSMP